MNRIEYNHFTCLGSILISDKHYLTKYKMLLTKKEISFLKLPALCGKTMSFKLDKQAVGLENIFWGLCSSFQNCFNSAVEDFWEWTSCFMPIKFLDETYVWTLNRHFKSFILSHSHVDLLVCFESFLCCILWVVLGWRSHSCLLEIILPDFLAWNKICGSIKTMTHSDPESSNEGPGKTIVFDCWYGVLCLKY